MTKENNIICRYLEKSGVYKISDNTEKVKHIVQIISRIPWGEVREIDEVIKKMRELALESINFFMLV